MSIDYTALKAELDAGHPVTDAYDADDQAAADQLNLANIEVDKLTTGQEAADATDGNEFNHASISDAQRQIWIGVLGWDTINLHAGIGLETATGMWNQGNTPNTKAALIATRTEMVSRTSQLGFGKNELTSDHVAYARAL